MKLHIGIAAPIATEDVADLLSGDVSGLPKGYLGAPFTAVLIAELLKQGHRVSAFTTDNSIFPQSEVVKASGDNFDFYLCAERPRAWRMNGWHLGRGMDGFAYERRLLAKIMTAAQPDIIHAHWSYEFALAAIKTGIPHLITCHDAPAVVLRFNPYPYRAMRYLLARLVFSKGRAFSTVSEYMLTRIQHYTQLPITVVPNPLADFVLASGRQRQRPGVVRLGLVCNGWNAWKNPKPALLAFAEFRKRQPEAELHLFGYGFGSGEVVQQWCLQQDLTAGMIFHGSTPHRNMIAQLNELDLLLHPALEESFGVVLAEAMALGLPIVAGRNSGAVPWVVGANNNPGGVCPAVLTDVREPTALVAAIEQALDADYPLRSAAGYARVRQMFAPAGVSKRYMALYEKLLPGASSAND